MEMRGVDGMDGMDGMDRIPEILHEIYESSEDLVETQFHRRAPMIGCPAGGNAGPAL